MTDYYAVAESALRTFVQTNMAAYFDEPAKQITKSDDTVLDSGKNYYFITYPGAFPIDKDAPLFGTKVITVSWEIVVDLISRWQDTTANSWSTFLDYRSAMFNLLNIDDRARNLNRTNGVKDAFIASEERPRYIPLRDNDPDSPASHIGQVCVVTVQHVINKT